MPDYATNANAFARGLRGEFDQVYADTQQETAEPIKRQFAIGSGDGRYEDYHIYREPGTFVRWTPEKGESRSYAGFDDLTKRLYTLQWSNGVKWNKNDEMDDRAQRKMKEVAQTAGGDKGRLMERVFTALLTATGDRNSLRSEDIPTALDGETFYSASHAEHSSGNIVSGTGVTTTAKIKTDWFSSLQRWSEMKFPRNKEYYFRPESIHKAQFTIFVSPANYELFCETFELENRLVVVQNVAATENVAGVSLPNLAKNKYGQLTEIVSFPRISGNDWYVFMNVPGKSKKPFIYDVVEEINEIYFDETTDSQGRNYNERGLAWDHRARVGYLNHNVSIKVDN